MTRGLPVLLIAALAACSTVSTHGQTQGATGATGSVGTTGTGGSTAGVTSGSSTGAPAPDAGCSPDQTSAQGDDCVPSFPCGCPFVCSEDPLETLIFRHTGTFVCEQSCKINADCPTIDTACVGGVCSAVPCGGGVGNGVFDSLCAMGSVPDSGTCIPIPLQFVGVDAGQCIQGGTATTSCDPVTQDRSDLAEICAPGFVCNGLLGDGGECLRACDDDQGCAVGEYCEVAAATPTFGMCLDAGS